MSQAGSLQSLHLIIEDIASEVNLSAKGIESYSHSLDDPTLIKLPLKHIHRLKSVFTLLEFTGAKKLTIEIIRLLKELPKKNSHVIEKQQLEVITTALVRLVRYMEYISQKQFDLPQLLIPAINDIRTCNNLPAVGESFFFAKSGDKPRPEKESTFVISEECATKSRHFRQMYQIGLIEVIRQTNLIGGLEMMKNALRKLDNHCLLPKCPNLWWIAKIMIDGYIENSLKLKKSRLKLFSQIDRQIRRIENKPELLINGSKAEMKALAKEMLYLITISDLDNDSVKRLYQHFSITKKNITDKMLHQEERALYGLTNQDYHSIADALIEEIDYIESIYLQCQQSRFKKLNFEKLKDKMIGLNNLLKILQVDDQIIRLTVSIDLIDKVIEQKRLLSEKESNVLSIALEGIKKSVNQPELEKYSGILSNKREVLSQSELKICESTHKIIKAFIQDFSNFIKNNRKATLLKNSSQLLSQVKQGFEILKIQPALEIIDECQNFLNYHIIKKPRSTTDDAITFFADIIGCLEFYLETLKFTRKPNPRIMQFAKNSLLYLNRLKKNDIS